MCIILRWHVSGVIATKEVLQMLGEVRKRLIQVTHCDKDQAALHPLLLGFSKERTQGVGVENLVH